ncbi:hypothetical protein HDV00_011478, partial [Rhizophlyctis rosea]
MVVHEILDLHPMVSTSRHQLQPEMTSDPRNSTDSTPSLPTPSVVDISDNADGRDPYLLASRVMPADHIRDIRKRRDGKKEVASFYEEQNEEIRRMLNTDDSGDESEAGKKATKAKQFAYKVAIQGSFIANIALSILQLYAAIS